MDETSKLRALDDEKNPTLPPGRSAPPPRVLPRILEIKRTLVGEAKRFQCALLRREGSHLVVLFVAPNAMNVHGVALPAGTLTFGHFWTDRPYNVYHWLDQATGATLGHYINLSANTVVTEDRLEWLDLIVDVLITPGGPPAVIDEDEIPATLDPELRRRIDAAQRMVLLDANEVLSELDGHRRALWPVLFPPGDTVP